MSIMKKPDSLGFSRRSLDDNDRKPKQLVLNLPQVPKRRYKPVSLGLMRKKAMEGQKSNLKMPAFPGNTRADAVFALYVKEMFLKISLTFF